MLKLGKLAGDPYRIDQMPHLSSLSLRVRRGSEARDQKLLVFLSREALTDVEGKFVTEWGFLREDLADGILLFPEIAASRDAFTFTYLHPGRYFLTVVADVNGDGFPSPGDVACASRAISVAPESNREILVDDVSTKN